MDEKRRLPQSFSSCLSFSDENFSSQAHPHNDVVLGLGGGWQKKTAAAKEVGGEREKQQNNNDNKNGW